MYNYLSDLRFACRALANNRIFASIAVLILGLGIGMNTAIFSGLYAYLWTPFPYAESERLVSVPNESGARHATRGRLLPRCRGLAQGRQLGVHCRVHVPRTG